MTEKILSVSIAAYNVQDTLAEALVPFTAEGISEYVDVMIVNDGSTDNTAAIASEYVNQYPDTFRLISKANGGWGSTLNVGVQEAKGKYFKQLDGDDFFSPENLNMFLKKLSSTNSDMVYTPFVSFDHQTGGILRIIGGLEGAYETFPINQEIPIKWCRGFLPAMHTITVKTSLLQKINIDITEHCFYTDVEFLLKVVNNCESITFFDFPIYYYRLARSGQSMSLEGVRKHYRDHQKMLLKMLDYFDKNVTDDYKKEMIGERLLGACNMQYLFYFALKCTKKQKKELIEYDEQLRQEYPEFYLRLNGHQISLLRKLNFCGYKIIAKQKMMKDKRLKQNIFEGC